MDSKEIHGRRLRVRSSKDKDRNDKAEAARKKFQPKRELTENDVTKHLVFAFMGFLGRQMEVEGLEDEVKSKMETAKDLLKESFDIPDDETLKVSRNLELIFLQNNRREIPVPKDETKEEEEEIDAKEVQSLKLYPARFAYSISRNFFHSHRLKLRTEYKKLTEIMPMKANKMAKVAMTKIMNKRTMRKRP